MLTPTGATVLTDDDVTPEPTVSPADAVLYLAVRADGKSELRLCGIDPHDAIRALIVSAIDIASHGDVTPAEFASRIHAAFCEVADPASSAPDAGPSPYI